MNQGFEEVRRSLQALSRYAVLQPQEIQRFERLVAEARAATNSFLLATLGTLESTEAGRLFARRIAQERRKSNEHPARSPRISSDRARGLG